MVLISYFEYFHSKSVILLELCPIFANNQFSLIVLGDLNVHYPVTMEDY